MGRRADPHVARPTRSTTSARGPTGPARTSASTRLDLVQLHCPPTAVFFEPATYENLRVARRRGPSRVGCFRRDGRRGPQALGEPDLPPSRSSSTSSAASRSSACSRGRAARASASSPACPSRRACSSGKYDENTTFAENDHRTYNRDGEAFDVGETFAGVPVRRGCAAAREVAALTPEGGRRRSWRCGGLLSPARRHRHPRRAHRGAGARNAAVGDLPVARARRPSPRSRHLQPRHSRARARSLVAPALAGRLVGSCACSSGDRAPLS